jgi:hypothetical protein
MFCVTPIVGRRIVSPPCLFIMKTPCDDEVEVVRLPPLWFEQQIFRLSGQGGDSTRQLGTTSSLIIWVEVYVASVTYFPPTERRVNSQERRGRRGGSARRGGRGWMKGGKLESSGCGSVIR